MSRPLPPRPSLEYLKNEAKDLLGARRVDDPHATLSAAQFAVARGYGFASWPALKAHVDSLSPAAPLAASGGGHGPAVDSPLAGRWVANLDRSQRHPANQFQRATLTISVTGETVTLTQDALDAEGRPLAGQMLVRVNGQPQTGLGGDGHALVATWVSPHLLQVVDLEDGVEVGRGQYKVSEDGQRLIVSTAAQVLAFDRA
jgi:hypothetical protein